MFFCCCCFCCSFIAKNALNEQILPVTHMKSKQTYFTVKINYIYIILYYSCEIYKLFYFNILCTAFPYFIVCFKCPIYLWLHKNLIFEDSQSLNKILTFLSNSSGSTQKHFKKFMYIASRH